MDRPTYMHQQTHFSSQLAVFVFTARPSAAPAQSRRSSSSMRHVTMWLAVAGIDAALYSSAIRARSVRSTRPCSCTRDGDIPPEADWDQALRDLNASQGRYLPRSTPSPIGARIVKPARAPSFDAVEIARQLTLQWVISVRASAVRAAHDALRLRSADRVQDLRRRSYIEPRESWSLEDLAQPQHDGSLDPDGPILLAVDGVVYNVGGAGAKFYAPGGEYHCFAGRDATRLLAKQRTEEETAAQLAVPLSVGERLVLAGWSLVLQRKYVKVGLLSDRKRE